MKRGVFGVGSMSWLGLERRKGMTIEWAQGFICGLVFAYIGVVIGIMISMCRRKPN